jgi:hypothetical protein
MMPHAEIFDRSGQGEGIRRNHADVVLYVDETGRIEAFRIDDGRVDIGENLELVGATHIVAVARRTVGHDPAAVVLPYLAGLERLDHAVVRRHAANPPV